MAKQKIPSLFLLRRDGQLVFLTEQERAGLAQVNPCSSEPSDSSLLDRLFSTNISSVYRLGKEDKEPLGGRNIEGLRVKCNQMERMLSLSSLVHFQTDLMKLTSCTSGTDPNMVKSCSLCW